MGAAPPGRGASPHWAEGRARTYLEGKGWRHLASNYRVRGGELDLVMADGETVVVVEVKQRRSVRYGHPAESIDARKLVRLRRTAQHYVVFSLRRPEAPLRIDAVLLLGDEGRHQIRHLRNVG